MLLSDRRLDEAVAAIRARLDHQGPHP
jgi:hypothetical protein